MVGHLGYIDRYKEPEKSRLFLCKPDRTTIGELHEAYNKSLNTNYNGIHELSFDIPFKIMKNHKYIRNPHVDLIRGHYLIRYERGSEKEYFVIHKPKNSTSDGVEVKSVECFLLPYELNRKIVRNFTGTKMLYNPAGTEGALNETLLRKTDWSVGYIDPDIALKYRTFDVTEQNLIEFIGELSGMYDAAIIWDTINKQINFYKNENIGTNKGLTIEYGKYLKSLEEEPDFENVTTRQYVYGKDGMSIGSVNPTGTDYIESFDYYMYPFERNESTREVIKHSNYLSDGLCHALLDYQKLIESKDGQFSDLLSQRNSLLETLLTKQHELATLNGELAIIEDNLATANATENPTGEFITQKENKLTEITSKESEIANIESQMSSIDTQIQDLKDLISIENNFTEKQIIERNKFTNERVWTNNHIFEADELYSEGVKQLQKVNQPRISYTIEAVDFLNVVECQRDWDKLVLGDIITVRYPNFGIDIKAKLISIRHGEDDNSLELEIANADDIESGFMTLKELFNKTVSSSTTIDMSKFKWDLSEKNETEIGKILNNIWDATQRQIQAGTNESVEISRRGIVIKDPNDPMKILIMQHGLVACSNDGGNTWSHAIRSDGIVGEMIIGKLILGERMFIGDENGTFEIKGNLLTIRDTDEKERVKLGEYETNKYGLQLKSKDGNNVILDEDGILQTWQEGRTDNVDASNPLTLHIYVPEDTISIKKAILRFRRLNFRAYSQGTESGGGSTRTTTSGGGVYKSTSSGGGTSSSTSNGGYDIVTSGDSGIDVRYGSAMTNRANALGESGSGHLHGYTEVIGHKHNITLPNHSHNFSVPSHSHTIDIDSHSHSVTIPSHTHGIDYGIFESTSATNISIHINGINRDFTLGGKFTTDRSNLDIAQFLNVGQWNQIDLYSSRLGRIDATVFIQVLMGYNE